MNNTDLELEPGVSTHDQVAAKLRARKVDGKVDVKSLEAYTHETLEEVFFVGAMRYDQHKKWHDLRRFEDIMHTGASKTDEDPKDRSRSDTLLLAHAVYTGDGKPLGEEIAKDMLECPAAGPDNYQLLSLGEKKNPPREQLAIEVAQMMNKSGVDAILWRLMMECGLGKVLIDYMSTNATPEEHEWAQSQMEKVSEVVYAFQPLFDAEDIARTIGVTFREGMSLLAMYGTPEKVVEAKQAETDALVEDSAGE